MADEADIFGIHRGYGHPHSSEDVLRMEANAANEAAQILFDAMIEIYQETDDPNIEAIALRALESVNREE